MRKMTQEDKDYRQGRSRRQVEDSETIMSWVFTIGTIFMIVGILIQMVIPVI